MQACGKPGDATEEAKEQRVLRTKPVGVWLQNWKNNGKEKMFLLSHPAEGYPDLG